MQWAVAHETCILLLYVCPRLNGVPLIFDMSAGVQCYELQIFNMAGVQSIRMTNSHQTSNNNRLTNRKFMMHDSPVMAYLHLLQGQEKENTHSQQWKLTIQFFLSHCMWLLSLLLQPWTFWQNKLFVYCHTLCITSLSSSFFVQIHLPYI